MKEIVIRRAHEKFGMINYKVVVEHGQTILIGNGETKRVSLEQVPVMLHAKQGWLKSKKVTIDSTTTELTLKYEKIKSRIAPWFGGFFVLTILLPKTVWDNSSTANTISIIGLSIIAGWTIYAFVIKRNDWIRIEKTTGDEVPATTTAIRDIAP